MCVCARPLVCVCVVCVSVYECVCVCVGSKSEQRWKLKIRKRLNIECVVVYICSVHWRCGPAHTPPAETFWKLHFGKIYNYCRHFFRAWVLKQKKKKYAGSFSVCRCVWLFLKNKINFRYLTASYTWPMSHNIGVWFASSSHVQRWLTGRQRIFGCAQVCHWLNFNWILNGRQSEFE